MAGGRATLGYSSLDHFLGDLEALGVAQALGDALAQRYLAVWPVPAQGAFFYFDNRRKVRYSGYPSAAGKISASDRILGGTTQLFVHDAAGHCLHMHSGPADDHMARTLLPFVQHFAQQIGREHVRGIVADQEMRSVSLFLALTAANFGFVTLGRSPTAQQEADFEVKGLFLPYLRDPQTGETSHWMAQAETLLHDRSKGLFFQTAVTLIADCRAGLPGRLIPVFHNLDQAEIPVEFPHQLYVARWESQERSFRDMRPCQNLDVNYGQKKIAVTNRRQERDREKLQQKLQTQQKRVASAQAKVQDYTERLHLLAQKVHQKQCQGQSQVSALRQEAKQAQQRRKRESRIRQAERLAAKLQIDQIRAQEKQRRLLAEQSSWQQKLVERQQHLSQTTQTLHQMQTRSFFDFDLEKDNLMTYLRMASENAHCFVQEQYFAGTLLEKVDEATMVRVIYNQPGWVQQQGHYLQVVLQSYRAPAMQAAVIQACQRVNQAQIELPSGHQLRMQVTTEILDW